MEFLSLERRKGDSITAPHLEQLGDEGWNLVGVTNNDKTYIVNFMRDEDVFAEVGGSSESGSELV